MFQPYLKILDKIEDFSIKSEFSNIYVIMAFGGFLTIVAGFMEYFFSQIYGIDAAFFVFVQTGIEELHPSAEPLLYISVLLLHLSPVLIIVVFSSGSSGFVNWNESYRTIVKNPPNAIVQIH